MKRILWNITFASLITLVAYVALYAIWGAILSGVENPTLKLFMIALMTTVAFSFFLLYIAKIKNSVGEDEVMSDYKNRDYHSLLDDFKLIIKRESKMLICMVAIVLICFLLNTINSLVFKKETNFLPTMLFAPMLLFSTVFKISFIGYAFNAVLDCGLYIVFLLIFRRKKYRYWMKDGV